ncbi:MFS transporter [Streptomyces sp. SM8]|uniref:MFS transporter n=1 Tax=Streptomyces sp. SM8 TaxID=1195457 RepID=UPI000C298046|nr:MFS transporter [Streptomyces sp. SM8]PKA36344.1 MFS transporter [Streptomyces sp. SM8]
MTAAPAPADAHVLDPETARRRYVTVSALFWFPIGLYVPSLVLILGERGLALAAVAAVLSSQGLTVALLELPTGGLSDVLGRRAVLAAGGVLSFAGLLLLALGTVPWVLITGIVLMGASRALASGPAEAWYVDMAQAHSGPEAELRTGLSRGSSAMGASLAVATLLGGLLPWLFAGSGLAEATGGLILPLSLPGLLSAALVLCYLAYVLLRLPEPPRAPSTLRSVLGSVPGTIASGVRLATRERVVRKVVLTTAAVGAALGAIELLTPGRAAAITGASESGAVVYAGLATAGFASSSRGRPAPPRSSARLAGGSGRAVLVLVYLCLGAAGPNENDLLHHRVASSARATALSVQSLALQAVASLGGLVAGLLPLGPLPLLLTAAVVGAGALMWVRAVPDGPRPGHPDGADALAAPAASGEPGR